MACWLLMCVNGNSFLVLTYTNAACLLPWMVHKSNLQYFSKVKVKENIYSQSVHCTSTEYLFASSTPIQH